MERYATRAAPRRFLGLSTAGAIALLTLVSCQTLNPTNWGAFGGSGGSGSIVSDNLGVTLELDLPNRAAIVTDENTADVFLTDLSDETLELIARGQAGREVSGTLVQVHIFLNPKPGKTPIESTAASATIRTVVLARGQIGVYDGAGFMLPGRSLKKGSASGSVNDAQTRLTRSTDGFEDLLGAARIDLSFGTKGDEQRANRIARVLRSLSAAAEPVE